LQKCKQYHHFSSFLALQTMSTTDSSSIPPIIFEAKSEAGNIRLQVIGVYQSDSQGNINSITDAKQRLDIARDIFQSAMKEPVDLDHLPVILESNVEQSSTHQAIIDGVTALVV